MLKVEKSKSKRKTKYAATAILLFSALSLFVIWGLEKAFPAVYLLPVMAAFFEASMVGGIADLFAIHVLFKHPFGLKIPHTAIIPNNKNKIGHSLSDFFRDNFLSEKYVKENINRINVSEKLGNFVERNKKAIVNKIIRCTISFFKTFDYVSVKNFIIKKTEKIVYNFEFKKYLLLFLNNIKNRSQHQKIVNFALLKLKDWLDNPENSEKVNKWIEDSIKSDGKGGTTFTGTLKSVFMGKQNLSLNVQELINKLNSVEGESLRKEINKSFSSLIELIQEDKMIESTIIEIKEELIQDRQIEFLVERLISQVNNWIEDDIIKVDSKIRTYIINIIDNLTNNLQINEVWKEKIQEKSLQYLPKIIVENGEKIDKYIVNYIEKLDAKEIATLIEEKVGDDLQYIRINGSLVGGLVGLVLFFVKEGIDYISPFIIGLF